MPIEQIINLTILTLTAGFGWAIIAYEGYARHRGWPVGSWLTCDFSWLQGIAYLALIGALALAITVGVWWHAFVVIIGANIFVRLFFPTFGPKSQIAALIGVVIGIALSVFMVWL